MISEREKNRREKRKEQRNYRHVVEEDKKRCLRNVRQEGGDVDQKKKGHGIISGG